jgi:alpha-D-xyloside xylohydrolase
VVYLPASSKWIDFWTGEVFEGGKTIVAPAPIETMPLYVKAGSIIPMGPFLQYATEKQADPLELRVYTGADGHFELYEDENEGYNYEKGKYAIIDFSWKDKDKILTIHDRKGDFRGMLSERTVNVVLVSPIAGTGIEPAEKYKSIRYTGKKVEIKMD